MERGTAGEKDQSNLNTSAHHQLTSVCCQVLSVFPCRLRVELAEKKYIKTFETLLTGRHWCTGLETYEFFTY